MPGGHGGQEKTGGGRLKRRDKEEIFAEILLLFGCSRCKKGGRQDGSQPDMFVCTDAPL